MAELDRTETETELHRALALLSAGEVVGVPTETVYGLAADGLNESAVRRVFAIKGRPPGHPVILHVGTSEEVVRYAADVPLAARRLMDVFWPGPLTLILPRSGAVPDVVTGGLPTVGLRMPAHPLTLALLQRFGRPLAAPSANRFGRVSPTTAEHVRADLGADVPLVLDGGACVIGLESTIVDVTGAEPRLRRPGAITPGEMQERAGVRVYVDDGAGLPVPGSLPSHYAPRAQVLLVPADELWSRVRELSLLGPVGVLDRGVAPPDLPANVTVCAMGQTGAELAQRLYAALRLLDERGALHIVSVMPEAIGLGEAIVDRLQRAAAPRP